MVKKQHTDKTPDGPCSKKGNTAGRDTSLLLGSHYLFHVKERTSFVDSQEYVVKFIINPSRSESEMVTGMSHKEIDLLKSFLSQSFRS